MTTTDLATTNTDDVATEQLKEAMATIETYYRSRGIFGDHFGFGERPAILVVDFANGWTDDAYAGGSRRLDQPVENTAKLLAAGREHGVPIVYTTSPWRPPMSRTGSGPGTNTPAGLMTGWSHGTKTW